MSPQPQRLYTLGPAGTYSDAAARRLLAHMKLDLPVVYTRTIPEVLERAEADADGWGVVPIENSDVGTVVQAQDALVRHALTARRPSAALALSSAATSMGLPSGVWSRDGNPGWRPQA